MIVVSVVIALIIITLIVAGRRVASAIALAINIIKPSTYSPVVLILVLLPILGQSRLNSQFAYGNGRDYRARYQHKWSFHGLLTLGRQCTTHEVPESSDNRGGIAGSVECADHRQNPSPRGCFAELYRVENIVITNIGSGNAVPIRTLCI